MVAEVKSDDAASEAPRLPCPRRLARADGWERRPVCLAMLGDRDCVMSAGLGMTPWG